MSTAQQDSAVKTQQPSKDLTFDGRQLLDINVERVESKILQQSLRGIEEAQAGGPWNHVVSPVYVTFAKGPDKKGG